MRVLPQAGRDQKWADQGFPGHGTAQLGWKTPSPSLGKGWGHEEEAEEVLPPWHQAQISSLHSLVPKESIKPYSGAGASAWEKQYHAAPVLREFMAS